MVNQGNISVLTVNSGSSSIKFALFELNSLKRIFSGKVERIGQAESLFTVKDAETTEILNTVAKAQDHAMAANRIMSWLQEMPGSRRIIAIGHRFVHGGTAYSKTERITVQMMDDLRQLSAFNPLHLPREIAVTEAFQMQFPLAEHMACFDTDFHQSMPTVAKLLPIPRRFQKKGIQRYGFHGLSYAYLMHELERTCGSHVSKGRIILAHLGNGASMAAVSGGHSMDTSMGLTPAGGLVMSTRSGELDPGLMSLLVSRENMTTNQFDHMVNHESGLLGISETSADIRDLLTSRSTDTRASEAIDLFCYQAKKYIGAYAAAIAGLDTLVFSGGIGENSAEIRSQICDGLAFLGIELDNAKNNLNAPVISMAESKVTVRVIATDEEWMMAQKVSDALGLLH